MESGENSSSMQSSSTGGGGGDDQEYESSRRGRGRGGGGGRGNYNYNLVFNNSNINEGSVNYTTSPTMLLNNMISPSPQLPPWSFGDPNFHNLMLWQQQPQPQPQPQSRVVAAGTSTSTSCTTSLINDFRPPNQSPFSGDPGRDSLLSSSSATATVAAESVAGKYHATSPPHTAAGGIGSDTGMGTSAGTSGNKSNTSSSKNPRKRTRASRRAPTTVLTTDTSNFRAMVQEFTGIPSSPFSPGAATSPLLSHRLSDLFASSVPIPGSSAFGLGPSSSSLSFRHAGYTSDHNHLSNLIRPSANASCYTIASAPTIQKPTDHHHQLHLNYSSSSSPSSSATDLRFHPISSVAGGITSTSNTQQAGLSTVSSFQQLMMGSDFQAQMLMTTNHDFHLSGSGNESRSGPAAIPLDLPENKADTDIGNQAGRGGGGGDDDNK